MNAELRIYVHAITFLLALFLFLNGYFPLRSYTSDIKNWNASTSRNALYKRTVIMVIDGMRNDFLDDADAMPYIAQIMASSNNSCWFQTKVETPTVTLPRIKALTMGAVPSFIDVILNFGNATQISDSIIHQAFSKEKKIIFFGDDTWVKLFPGMFERSDGTTSFFVKDYTEVDHNVTRHLHKELARRDWDIMVLHYLGLDHIGHIQGPRSPLIKPKLQEMDKVVQLIHEALKEWEYQSAEKSFFIMTGDHGMKNSGGHGGSTFEEIMVPFLTFGTFCEPSNKIISQIDIAPTLSVLLGLNPPSTSIGKPIVELLVNLKENDILHFLNSYFIHLQSIVNEFGPTKLQEEINQIQEKAFLLETEYFQNTNADINISSINTLYFKGISEMSDYLASTRVNFDYYNLIISTVVVITTGLLITLEWINITQFNDFDISNRGTIIILVFTLVLYVSHSFYCYTTVSSSHLCIENSVLNNLEQLFVIASLAKNLTFIIHHLKNLTVQNVYAPIVFLSIGNILHTISMSSSSFVEEEHQTWYFLILSSMLYLLHTTLKFPKFTTKYKFMKWILILILIRIAKNLNKTGDASKDVPDIADWLKLDEHKVTLTLVFITGLSVLSLLTSVHCQSKQEYLAVNSTLFCIFLFRSTERDIWTPYNFGFHNGTSQAQTSFILILLVFVKHIFRYFRHKDNTAMINGFLLSWILLSALLLTPHNVILIPLLIATSDIICESITKNVLVKSILHVWLANIFYFFQGNSNNLASIDVAPGYIGQTSFNVIYVGFLLFVHTYSTYVMVILLLVKNIINTATSQKTLRIAILTILNTLLTQKLILLSFYCIIMIILSSHLFVWSVFSPKLIYEFCHCITTVLLMFVIHTCVWKSTHVKST